MIRGDAVMVTCSFAEMMLGGVCDGHRKPIKTQGFAANAPVARYAKECNRCNRYERRRLLQVFRLLQCFCVFDDAFKLGESAQMWSESAIPRVATCFEIFEAEEIIHFDLSHFLCLARTDKQMVGRTSFNHVQTPLTFDNASRIHRGSFFLQVGRALAPLRSAAWDITRFTRDGENNHQKSALDVRLPEVSRSAHHWEWPVIQCCGQAKAS